ncbi:MAG: SLC13/DASS family transporter [Planctomycetia bacterium]|nr:SLC13/DASS family transporter [Planctomycetia bacterium]
MHLDRVGLILGPVVMLAWIAWGPSEAVTPEAHRLAGVLLLTIIWWLTEPIPIPATGLCAVVLAVLLGAVPADRSLEFQPARIALAPFGNPTLFFLLGGMFIGRAMSRHGLDRRIALSILTTRWAARSAGTLLFAVGLSVMVISMWISNTAATAMIYPVTLGIISVLATGMGADAGSFARSPYASALLLMTSYASSVGGIATPIGTTTNVVAMGFFRQKDYFDRAVDFGRWTMVGIPMMLVLGVALFTWLKLLAPAAKLDLAALRVHLRRERSKLGAWRVGELNTLAVFLTVVSLWIAPSVLSLASSAEAGAWFSVHFPEEIVAMLAPILLFLLPVDWRNRKFSLEVDDFGKIDWGTLLLFGSGMSLGNLMFRTGLVRVIGQTAFDALGSDDIWLITAIAIAGGILLSEFTSNAATATALIPVVMAICREADVDPITPLMGVTFGASFGSALPVSTPPNAIVYGSGLLPARRMILAGIGFDLACGVVIWSVLRTAYSLGWTPLSN